MKIPKLREIPNLIGSERIINGFTSKIRIANKDLTKIDVARILKNQAEKLSILEEEITSAGSNISGAVDIINKHFDGSILILSNDSLSIDVDNLGKVVEKSAIEFLRKELKMNVFLQLTVIRIVQDQLEQTLPVIKNLINGRTILLSDIKQHLQVRNPKLRTCQLNIIQILFQLVRWQFGKTFIPLQSIVNGCFTKVTDYVLTFFLPTMSNNPILASITDYINEIVIKVVTVITSISQTVNVFFNYVIYGVSIEIIS